LLLDNTSAEKAEVVDPKYVFSINKLQIEEMLNNGGMEKGSAVDDWLQTYNSERPNKKAAFKRFCTWLGKTPEEILELRRQDQNRTFEKLCIKYHHYLTEEKKLASNTAVSQLGTVRSYFQFHDLQLNFKRNEIPSMVIKPVVFSLTAEHVRKMFQFANVWQRAIMIVMAETGLRISDILGLKKSDVENMLLMDFPEMEVVTKKEGVLAKIHLSSDAKEVLKLHMSTIEREQGRLFNKDFDTVNKSLKQLFNKAFPEVKANVTPHDFRRLFISTASNCSINEWHIRLLCGKKIANDMLPYLRNLDLKSDFVKIVEALNLFPKNTQTTEQLKGLEIAVKQLEGENMALRTRTDLLQKDFQKLKESVEGMYLANVHLPATIERTLLNKKTGKLERWIETINTTEELETADKRFMERVLRVGQKKE
jgi:integrase